jgi:peptidoglycan/xylan/chitin deacetylase (PgdA/CDA1 family)
MIMTSLKYLAIAVALLAGGAALAMIGFLTRQQIIARQASAPEAAVTAQHSTLADQISQATPVVTTQEAEPIPSPSTGPAQNGSAESAATPTTSTIPPCYKPDGLGLSRVVQIDTSGGPQFGSQHFKGYDFLRDKEVVLTFDDGPWPGSTAAVLKALADQCVKATFFEIGEYARWHPEITKQAIDAGMTVGTYTWSHKDLARNPYANDPEKAEQEIEMGNSAVHSAAGGGKVAPFFRFPDLQPSPQLTSYLGGRNIAIFSTDIDSRDFTMHKPQQVVDSVMNQLAKRGRGIVLLQDFHRNTAEALPELFRQLKLAGYKVVHMVPKEQLTTIAKYDEMFNQRGNMSPNAEPGSATTTGHSMFMYVPARRRKGAPTMGTTGAH